MIILLTATLPKHTTARTFLGTYCLLVFEGYYDTNTNVST